MKIFKTGFTLAEVLITLSIIGVVAAITLPTTMGNTKYQQIGTKLSKFNSTLEAAASEFVVSHDEIESIADAEEFINSSFIFKNTGVTASCPASGWSEEYTLKDDTKVEFYCYYISHNNNSAGEQAGDDRFVIRFNPDVSGLPSNGKSTYTFTVTEKGYVVPYFKDSCLKTIYHNKWEVSPSFYKTGGACISSS